MAFYSSKVAISFKNLLFEMILGNQAVNVATAKSIERSERETEREGEQESVTDNNKWIHPSYPSIL